MNGMDAVRIEPSDFGYCRARHLGRQVINKILILGNILFILKQTRINYSFLLKVTDYLNKKFAERNSPNRFNITCVSAASPWLSDPDEPLYLAGRKAIKKGLVVIEKVTSQEKV